jgi:nucleoid-associated protein YgaU
MTHTTPEFIRLLVLRLLVLALAVGAVFLLLTSANADELPAPTTSHVVAAGDTLWALAADLTEPGADVRRVVAEIEQLNGLDGATIYPGQVLTLPTG